MTVLSIVCSKTDFDTMYMISRDYRDLVRFNDENKKKIILYLAGLITRLRYSKARSLLVDRIIKKAEND